MVFVDEVKALSALSARIPELLEHIKTKAATKTALVEPFIRALGYDTSNPTEVVPDFEANLDLPGVNKDKYVDFAIIEDGNPIILIEVKSSVKDPSVDLEYLYNYLKKLNTRLFIATNGINYRFYRSWEKTKEPDLTPFLEIDLLNFNESLAQEVKKLIKSSESSTHSDSHIASGQSLLRDTDTWIEENYPELKDVVNLAVEETKQMMEMGVDISDSLVITPLGWTANKYPEIAEYCNQVLTELVEQQINNPTLDTEDKTITGEF